MQIFEVIKNVLSSVAIPAKFYLTDYYGQDTDKGYIFRLLFAVIVNFGGSLILFLLLKTNVYITIN